MITNPYMKNKKNYKNNFVTIKLKFEANKLPEVRGGVQLSACSSSPMLLQDENIGIQPT